MGQGSKAIQFEPSSRVRAIPQNFFSILEEKIITVEQSGMDVIRLDIGSPDMAPPEDIVESLVNSARNPHNHGYQSLRGPALLRRAWVDYYAKYFDVRLNAETEVLPLPGSKEGIFNFTSTWAQPGSIVLIPDPGYMTYTRSALFAGAEIVNMPLDPENGFLPDFSAIPVDVLKQVKIMWLNYPNNPTAAVVDLSFFEKAVNLAMEYGFWICHDSAYNRITYDDYQAPSILQVQNSEHVAVEFNSLSKSHNMPGWRVGSVVGNSVAIQPLTRLEANLNSGQFRPIIDASIHALTTDTAWMAERNKTYQSRRDAVISGLEKIGIFVSPPKGSIYVWAPISTDLNSVDFAIEVLEKTGVSLTPGSVFGAGGDGFVRISLTTDVNRITEAMERLRIWSNR